MIKAMISHKVKKDSDILSLLLELRAAAMQYPGFVGAENLLNSEDVSDIILVSTWQTVEAWRGWEESRIRASLYKRAEAFLVREPTVAIYRIMPTQRWA